MSSPDVQAAQHTGEHTGEHAGEHAVGPVKPTVLPEGHEMHRVAIVVFCEASGVDEGDAAAMARMALASTLRQAGSPDPSWPSSTRPSCAACGSYADVTDVGVMGDHHQGEIGVFDESDFPLCKGSGLPPHERSEPVVSVEYRNGHVMRARIFDTVEAGMAAGNGYLWTRPTAKAFR